VEGRQSVADLRLTGLSKNFGDVVAVENFTLWVDSREFLVLVGPSGCGKTTLLRLVAGLERQDSGHILIDGVLADDIPAGKRNVQMIFHNYALWPHMKVMDEKSYSNLSLPLKVRKWAVEQIGERVNEVTRRVGLERELFGRKPTQLSAGQQQRVALSRSMTTAPRVMLMDEPITNLDPPSRVKVRHEIKKLHREMETTTLYVTHNMSDAFVMADRIALMRDGTLVQVGTEQELRQHPRDDFVRDFLAS
jgi:multiple sugar transport system ATP-binding protein